MKVNAWKNLDVEVEVDVSLEDVLNELHDMANEEGLPRRKIAAIDSASKILAVIGVDCLASVTWPRSSVAMLRERLLPLVLWCEQKLLETKP